MKPKNITITATVPMYATPNEFDDAKKLAEKQLIAEARDNHNSNKWCPGNGGTHQTVFDLNEIEFSKWNLVGSDYVCTVSTKGRWWGKCGDTGHVGDSGRSTKDCGSYHCQRCNPNRKYG